MKNKFRIRNRFMFFADLVFIVAAMMGSFVLRLELDERFFIYLPQVYWLIGIALIIKPAVYYRAGLYRRLWLYASTKELKSITATVSLASVLVSLTAVILRSFQVIGGFPRSVLAIDWLLSLVAVGGLRFSIRLIAEGSSAGYKPSMVKRILVIGAGDAGALVVREMQKSSQLNTEPVAFLDDDPTKQKLQIHGVSVVGRLDNLEKILNASPIHEVVFAIPTAPGHVIRKVADICRLKGVPFRTIPGMYELIGGKVSVSRLREVDINDLLRRDPIRIDEKLVGTIISGKRIMVTGAGGSIGSELCRQIARWGPSELILLGHGENSIYEVLLEFREQYPSLPMYPIIADIRDEDRLNMVFAEYRPELVYHTAAHKHVPLMETNVEEAVTNNILGTKNVVEACLGYDVDRLIMISSDKAVRPSSVMGATKRIAETVVLDAAHRSGRTFSVVRFGNVLGSRGSIVPRFKTQIIKGGPVTITHPDMYRYFMTIPEAVHLVLQASAMGECGSVFILNMGEQIRVLDLAEDLIRLSGLEPGKDIDIVFTGIRPGEKLREMLWDEGANYQKTEHSDVFRLAEDEDIVIQETTMKAVDELIYLSQEGDTTAIMELLDEVIPGAAIRSTPPLDYSSLT